VVALGSRVDRSFQTDARLCEELVLTLRRMSAGGLVLGAAGNASARAGDLAAVRDGHAVVVRGHGPVCFGVDLADALARAFALEENARIQALAKLLT
jgi:ribulose-5-phosphate 4-epimerase/fuculose-1-phosphate aldolase